MAKRAPRKKTASKPAKKPKARTRAKRVVAKRVAKKASKRVAKRVVKRPAKRAVKRVNKKVARAVRKPAKSRSQPKRASKQTKPKRAKRTNKRVGKVKRAFKQAVKRVTSAAKRALTLQQKVRAKRPAKAARGTRAPHTAKPTPLSRVLEAQRTKLRPSTKPNPLVVRMTRYLDQTIPPAEILLGGSYAKSTYLKGNYDIDIFVRFPRGTPDSTMSEWIATALPKAQAMHGSRTYYQVKRGKFLFEIVPVCSVTNPDQILNVTDMSPLHVAHVKNALSSAQKDDVRLAKQFCKAAGVYGAESYIKGFSGYALELLIAHYGSFEKLLRAAAGEGSDSWPHAHGSKLVLDPEKYYRDSRSALLHLNESKTQAPIVLVDPVDKNRNATAALSKESYERFRAVAQAFLQQPSKLFFDTTLSQARVRAAWKGKMLIFVTVQTPKDRADIAGCKVLAHHEQAIRVLMENDFPLVHSEWRYGEKTSTCWYVLDAGTMPKMTEQRGPPAHMSDAVQAFREKHTQAVMRVDESGKQRWFAPILRSYTQADKAIASAWRGTRFTLKK